MKIIQLSQGKVALVNDRDYKRLNLFKWFYDHDYARTTINGHKVYMHRFILDTPAGYSVDHINQDKLDNRRRNLRLATAQQNSANAKKSSANTSGYRGVSWSKKEKRWRAVISVGYKTLTLGYFVDIKEAAKAYNDNATVWFGDFARLNKI